MFQNLCQYMLHKAHLEDLDRSYDRQDKVLGHKDRQEHLLS